MKKPISRPSRAMKASWRISSVGIFVFLMMIFTELTARAFTSADADILMAAHTKAFYRTANGGAYYLKCTGENKLADFWTEAEQMEMVLDAYERTANPQMLVMYTNLFRGFLAEHGQT